MAKYFTRVELSPREKYEQKYKASRMNLLLVIIMTAINLILMVTNSDRYFLFSAFIPYYTAFMGMFLCGRLPEEYYEEVGDITFLHDSVFIILLIVAILLTLLYLLAFFLSNKRRVGWIIFALSFFALDTIGMLVIQGIALDSILDIVFHGWVIFDLSMGIVAYYKLKKLPSAEEEAIFSDGNISVLADGSEETSAPDGEEAPAAPADAQSSFILRPADPDVKHRVLLETRLYNFDICYRRVKATHTNELVINGNVYDEIEGVMEYPHVLKAQVDGHIIEAGYTGTHSFISVDGQDAARKLRLY